MISDQPANGNPPSDDDWQPCVSGQITGMVQRLRAKQRASAIRRMAVPATAVLLLVLAGFYYNGQSRPGGMFFKPGGLSCDEVHEYLPAYAKGQVSPERARQLEEHLADCPECRKMHEKMGGRVAVPMMQARAESDREQQRWVLAAR